MFYLLTWARWKRKTYNSWGIHSTHLHFQLFHFSRHSSPFALTEWNWGGCRVTVPSPSRHPLITSHPVESQCNKWKGDEVTRKMKTFQSANYGLWIMDYELWIMNYGLWIMDYELWIMNYGLWIMYYWSIGCLYQPQINRIKQIYVAERKFMKLFNGLGRCP